MSKKLFIKDFKEGQSIIDYFLVNSKKILTTKNGNKYMSLVFQDKTGLIDGKIWDEKEYEERNITSNDFVKIEADVKTYQDNLQLNVKRIKKIGTEEVDISDFIPHSAQDTNQMLKELREISKEVKNPYLLELLDKFFEDEEFKKKFRQSPAAKQIHHVYIGGLLEHTLSVVKICSFLAKKHYSNINFDLLITGTILHDIGKIYELSHPPAIDYTSEGRLLGHILLGFKIIQDKINSIPNFPENLQMLLQHLIISHHGQYEWGSPKLPQTIEAIILHYIDDLDAKLNSIKQLMNLEINSEDSWTAYHKTLGRKIYKEK